MWLQKLGSHSNSRQGISVMGLQNSHVVQTIKTDFYMGKNYTNITQIVTQTLNTNTHPNTNIRILAL